MTTEAFAAAPLAAATVRAAALTRPQAPIAYDSALIPMMFLNYATAGWSLAEIASAFGQPIATVKGWVKYPEFNAVFSQYHDISLAFWENLGRTDVYYSGDDARYQTWATIMRSRFAADGYK